MNRLHPGFQALFMLCIGALLTFSYAPYNVTWLPFLCCTLFFLCIIHCKPKHKVTLGFCFALGWFTAGLSWVHISIHSFGGLPLIFSLALMLLLALYLSVYPTITVWVLNKINVNYWFFVLPLLWYVTEYLRSTLFTGFPWLSIGYTQVEGPLAAWIPILGETGVAVLVVWLSLLLSLTITKVTKVTKTLSLCLVLIISLMTMLISPIEWVTSSNKSAEVAVIQGNIAQELRWVPEQDEPTMQRYQNLTSKLWHSTDIILWPEAAIPRIEPLAEPFLNELDNKAFDTNTGLLTGLLDYDFDSRIAFNNVVSLGKRHPAQKEPEYTYQDHYRFSKHHLLPIGEFVPFEQWLRKLAPIFDLPMSSFTRGDYVQPNLVANGWHFVPAICFEIAFPRQIRANITRNTDALLTVSNDAWFKDSHGPHQHLQIAQMRALEFGLPVIRGTNNGVTAIISPTGVIEAQLPQFQPAVLTHTLKAYSGNTPYRQYGERPTVLFLIILLSLGIVFRNSLH